jgi:hypothetical protein
MAAPLPDGSALIAGGYSGRQPTDAVEIFDPESGRFREAARLPAPRADGTVTTLGDGRVLIAGGTDGTTTLASAVIYDPSAGTFSATGSMTIPRAVHTASLLRDGRVLITGGKTVGERVVDSAETYDPATGRFTETGALNAIRYKHAQVTLKDGRVLVVGGAPLFDLGRRYRQAELYNPATGRFTRAASTLYRRYHLIDSVVTLADGNVLVAGDAPVIEVYDVKSRRFRTGPRLGIGLSFATATKLADGSVLIAGGYDSFDENPQRTAWIYRAARR